MNSWNSWFFALLHGAAGEDEEAVPQRYDVCIEPLVKGRPCKGKEIQQMFYFNSDNGTCVLFDYGGCGGNGNRFSTKKECLDDCKPGAVA